MFISLGQIIRPQFHVVLIRDPSPILPTQVDTDIIHLIKWTRPTHPLPPVLNTISDHKLDSGMKLVILMPNIDAVLYTAVFLSRKYILSQKSQSKYVQRIDYKC